VSYTAVVTNTGPQAAEAVVLRLQSVVPSNDLFASDPACQLAASLQELNCALGTLAMGETRTVSFTFTPQLIGTETTWASVSSGTTDPKALNNEAWVTLAISGATTDLSITSASSTSSPAPFVPFTITFNVHNAGPLTATSVLVTAKLTGLKFLKAQPAGCISKNGGNVSCPLFTLAPGASKQIPIAVVSILPGTYVTTFAVAATEPDPAVANNAGSVSVTTPPNADLSVRLTAFPNPATVGQPIAYSMMVTNAGPSTATNVTATLAFNNGVFAPGALTFVSASPGCVLMAPQRQVVCTAATLAKGATQAFTVTVSSGAAMNLGTIASVAAAEIDLAPGNNAVSHGLPIAP
jgi:uncharacterized repeat protein (TIGR01451 family)